MSIILNMESHKYEVVKYENFIDENLLNKKFCNNSDIASTSLKKKQLISLKYKLLKFGGKQAFIPSSEDDIVILLKRGIHKVSNDVNTKKISGKIGESHANVSEWWIHNKERISIMTGYALSDRGMWTQHSWCYDNKLKIILESCQRKTNYFGIVLSFEDSYEFYLANSK